MKGARNMLTAKQAATVTATSPVRPPSLMPTALSAAMMSGVVPVAAPSAVPAAADRYVTTDPGTWPSLTSPAKLPSPNMAPPMSNTITSV
jgi:hypothetical protein